MTFNFWFIVPLEDNGWTGTRHMPTLTIHASTQLHAERMADEILKHLPQGSTRTPLYAV